MCKDCVSQIAWCGGSCVGSAALAEGGDGADLRRESGARRYGGRGRGAVRTPAEPADGQAARSGCWLSGMWCRAPSSCRLWCLTYQTCCRRPMQRPRIPRCDFAMRFKSSGHLLCTAFFPNFAKNFGALGHHLGPIPRGNLKNYRIPGPALASRSVGVR